MWSYLIPTILLSSYNPPPPILQNGNCGLKVTSFSQEPDPGLRASPLKFSSLQIPTLGVPGTRPLPQTLHHGGSSEMWLLHLSSGLGCARAWLGRMDRPLPSCSPKFLMIKLGWLIITVSNQILQHRCWSLGWESVLVLGLRGISYLGKGMASGGRLWSWVALACSTLKQDFSSPARDQSQAAAMRLTNPSH